MMTLHLIAVFTIGAVAALLTFAGARLFGRSAPRSVLVLVAGGAMLAYSVYDEYSWAGRMTASLPSQVTVLREYRETSPLSPWTYAFPRAERMTAIDRRSIQRNPGLPGMLMTELLMMQRNQPTRSVPMVVDCPGQRRAFLSADQAFEPDGMPKNPAWERLDPGDPLLEAACR